MSGDERRASSPMMIILMLAVSHLLYFLQSTISLVRSLKKALALDPAELGSERELRVDLISQQA